MSQPKTKIHLEIEYYYIERLRRMFNLKDKNDVIKYALALLSCAGDNMKNGEKIVFVKKDEVEDLSKNYEVKVLTNFND